MPSTVDPVLYETPALGVGGAFSAQRSFTSAQAASGVADVVTALVSDQNVSITLATVWGERTVSATLQPSDPRTLESVALRFRLLYEILADRIGTPERVIGTGEALRRSTVWTQMMADALGRPVVARWKASFITRGMSLLFLTR